MKLKTLLSGIEVLESAVPMDTEVRGVSYDSRHTAPGDVFVAITGYETDGHKYIAAALEKGAAAVLCERAPEKGAPYIRVADSRLALALASKNFFGDPCSEMKMIGITGTNGKTTSAHLLKHVLEEAVGAKVGLIGTSGNMIGGEELPAERTTPESYELQALLRRMADEGCTHVVMEVSSHSLVLHRVAGLRFAAGIFTNLTRDHLDFHVTMEAYAEAKAMMLPMCAACAVNLDDDWARFMIDAAPCPVITFSEKYNEADLVAKDLRFSPSGVKFCAVRTNEIQRVSLGIPGRFSVYNAMGVLACCRILGLNLESCASALATAEGVRGRMEVVPSFPDCTVLIDYAHTPDALQNLLKSMREVSAGRIVLVFGCGGDRDREKRPIMGAIAVENADYVIVTSDNPRTEDPDGIIAEILSGIKGQKPPKVIPDRREAIRWALERRAPGDLIILAGKGHETYQEVNHVKTHMDEREIVAEITAEGKVK